MADAAELLARRYVLQVTNVPYLGRGKQTTTLADYIVGHFPDAKADLATAMVTRLLHLALDGGTVASVTPQNWLFLGSYTKMRETLLKEREFNLVCDLGPAAFHEMNWWAARTALVTLTNVAPSEASSYLGINADTGRDLAGKPGLMSSGPQRSINQFAQLKNPDHRISVHEAVSGKLLSEYADVYVGFQNGDTPRWVQHFWENLGEVNGWSYFQLTSDITTHFGGRHSALKWDRGHGAIVKSDQARIQGREAWGKDGVIVRQMRHLPAGLYLGDLYDQSSSAIIPKDKGHLPAIASFVMSDEFHTAVRKVDPSVAVTNATFVKVPFDLKHWQRIAAERYPNGLPKPYSVDPTQWLFHGHPADAEAGTALHVSLARLCGYSWPSETDPDMRLSPEARSWIKKVTTLPHGDADGLLCLPAVAGARSLAERLRGFLAAAFGKDWSEAAERRLLTETDARLEKRAPRDASLEGWVRDRAFRQHCVLFHQRPFLWHIWDGQKDGSAAIVHYHRLTQANLEKLTFSLLGDWIGRMKADDDGRRVEAATILQQRLQAILEGEEPYDVFVRWKPLAKQALGWEPNLDDGVRLNIRPFVQAEVLRDVPKVRWTKDRGTDSNGSPWFEVFKSERINDHHTTLAEKRKARGLK
jgi:hypothetical protein